MNLGGFSLSRLLGISAAKARLSRRVGFPLFGGRSGRQRALGALIFKLLGFCLVLAIAWPASAQSLTMPTIVFGLAAASDQASTIHTFRTNAGFREANPLIPWVGRSETRLLATAALTDGVTLLLAHRLHRTHPKLVISALYLMAAARFGFAVINVSRASIARGH